MPFTWNVDGRPLHLACIPGRPNEHEMRRRHEISRARYDGRVETVDVHDAQWWSCAGCGDSLAGPPDYERAALAREGRLWDVERGSG